MNAQGQTIFAQGNPPFTEITRQGVGWSIQTSTLFAPLTAVPTTVAALEIFNNIPGGQTSLVVSDVFADQIVGTTVVSAGGIYAQVSTSKAAPSTTALSVFSANGRQFYSTTAAGRIITGVGTTVVANGWRPWGNPMSWGTEAATPGPSWNALVDGRLTVPPNCSLCLHVVSSVATASSFQVGASFYEVVITNNVS